MRIHYKYKSDKYYKSVAIDGPFVSVGVLKRKIFQSKSYGKGKDFDLKVIDPQTNLEYKSETSLIPKDTWVLIRRIPQLFCKSIIPRPRPINEEAVVTQTEPVETDDFGPDIYLNSDVLSTEDAKMKTVVKTPALDQPCQGRNAYTSYRGFKQDIAGRNIGPVSRQSGLLERKTPHPGYICFRCKVPGHFIQHCPTNGDPDYDIKKVKQPHSIPKSMLVTSSDGSYVLPNGHVAVLKPNEAAFERAMECLPSTTTTQYSVGEIPRHLHCPLCKQVMKNAVLTSKCCFMSFCDKCIRQQTISNSRCFCGATNVLADDLLPNKTLRETIDRILESSSYKRSNSSFSGSSGIDNDNSSSGGSTGCLNTLSSSTGRSNTSAIESVAARKKPKISF